MIRFHVHVQLTVWVLNTSGFFSALGPARAEALVVLNATRITQPTTTHYPATWNSLYASTYWNMRLKDAQVQNDILLSDFTRNLVVVGRQPRPEPNFASYVSSARPHRLAVVLPHAA